MATILVGIYPWTNLKERNSYPLVSADCSVSLEDVYCLTELRQEYICLENTAEHNEVHYVFPLPPLAAVSSFKAIINETKTINGVVLEKDEARNRYESAISKGKKAALLEKESIDIFRISLGNIKPKDKVSVHISYVSLISSDGTSPNDLRLIIPVTIGQRYGASPVSSLTNNMKNTFNLNLAVTMCAPVTSISSPTHPVSLILGRHESTSTSFTPNKALVTLNRPILLEEDIVIVVSAQGLDSPRCTVERWSKVEGTQETTDAFALTFVPKVDLPTVQSQEYIFLVDRSGSMSGSRINSVKEALQIMLRSLPSRNTTFNIISFGSDHSTLWPTSQTYNKDTVDEASKHVETFQADFGGTELAKALDTAYRSKSISSTLHKPATAVFVLTDGDSWDLRGVADQVAKSTREGVEAGHILRTFVLGVGDSIAVGMCETIARAGQGVAVFVGSREKPDAKLINLLRAARSGVIDKVSIDWGSRGDEEFEVINSKDVSGPSVPSLLQDDQQPALTLFDLTTDVITPELGPEAAKLDPPPRIQQAPKSTRLSLPVYAGFRCSIYAIVRQRSDSEAFPSSMKINGEVLGQAIKLEVPISRAENLRTRLIHTLAARALVEQLEDEPHSATKKAEIVRLGTRYSIATSATSFVAIEDDTKDVVVAEQEPVHKEDDFDEYEEEDDEDMGFNLFDDGPSFAAPPAPMARFLKAAGDSTNSSDSGQDGQEKGKKLVKRSRDPGHALYASSMAVSAPLGRVAKGSSSSRASSPIIASSISSVVSASSVGAPQPTKPALSAPPPPPSPPSVPSIPSLSVSAIARVQGFNGAFEDNPETVRLLLQGKALPPLPSSLRSSTLSAEDKSTVWITIIALAILAKHFNTQEERTAWSMLAAKAQEVVSDILDQAGLNSQDKTELVERLKQEAGRQL